MRMPTKREWAMLALVLPVILLAAAATDPAEEDSSLAVAEVARPERSHAEAPHAALAGDLDLAQLRREVAAVEPADAFASKSWYVPPPPPPPPPPTLATALPPPAPTAPPLPFTYLGKFQDSAQPVFFLLRGDRLLTVKAGDVIEGTYRLEGVAGAMLSLTYLPLNIKQQLNIGSAG